MDEEKEKELWEENIKQENKHIWLRNLKWKILGHRGLKFNLKKKIKTIKDLDFLENVDVMKYYTLLIVMMVILVGLSFIATIIQIGSIIYEWIYPTPEIPERMYPYIIPALIRFCQSLL